VRFNRAVKRHVLESKRYLGLELSGAKNQKTSLAALEYYPQEKKIFLLDIFDRVGGHPENSNTAGMHSSDEALVELIQELKPGVSKMGVNVPLELPPCISCSCKGPRCKSPEVKWMTSLTRKIAKTGSKSAVPRVLEFTPYTQRPIELWVRYQVLPKIAAPNRIEIDETLGGNKAPLTARMQFLKRSVADVPLAEVWPKLTIAILASELGLNKRIVSTYRRLEEGLHAREVILEALAKSQGIFIYERDVRKLSHSLAAFDAFVCAYTALLSEIGKCAKMPKGFPAKSGWLEYPLGAP
jgi:Protein of unknown function (DUF429)